jgi:hypothetical protein
MSGKSKCKILKQIRQQIAAANDIAFVTTECKFQGECSGTCPKCEAEVRYLEQQLEKRRLAGKAVAVAGIAAALIVTSVGCVDQPNGGDPLPPPGNSQTDIVGGEPVLPELPGEMVIETIDPTQSTEPLMGDPVPGATVTGD